MDTNLITVYQLEPHFFIASLHSQPIDIKYLISSNYNKVPWQLQFYRALMHPLLTLGRFVSPLK